MKPKAQRRRCERESAVLKFLINHPQSLAEEVFQATGFGVMTNTRFLRQERIKGIVRWSVNRLKWVHWMRNLE